MAVKTVDIRQNLGSALTGRFRSPNIWHDCPWDQIVNGEIGGTCKFEDFNSGGLITSPTTEASLVGIPYIGFGSAGSTITYDGVQGGGLVCTEATDNEAVYFKDKVGSYQISSLLGPLWFECRVKVSAITNNQIGFIAGLLDDTAMTVIVPLSTANPPIFATTGNFVGFWGREEDAGAVRSTYVADGVTSVVVQSAIHQFVADTYVKLGMKFIPKDPINSNYPTLSFYVNNLRQTSYKTIPNATGTDFPADVRMNFMFGHRLGASTSSLTTCDWFRIAQLDV